MPSIGKSFEECRDYLKKGWIVAYPTETTYGLGVNPFDKEAVNYLNQVKDRSQNKIFILLVKDMEMLEVYAEIDPHRSFLDMIWPGAVSVVLKAKEKLPEWIVDENGNSCFRISSAKFVEKLFEYIDRPLVSTSANPEGFPTATDPSEIISYFQNQEKLIVFPDMFEDVTNTVSSTVIDLTKSPPEVIRKGDFNIVF